MPNFYLFLPPVFLNGWANGSRKRLSIVETFQLTLSLLGALWKILFFLLKILHYFPGGVENTFVLVSRKRLDQFETSLRIKIKVLEVHKSVQNERGSPPNIVVRWKFGGLEKLNNCVVENGWPGKTTKPWNIAETIQPMFKFSPKKDRPESGHLTPVTDDLENIGEGQHFQKANFRKRDYYYAHVQYQIWLMLICDQ